MLNGRCVDSDVPGTMDTGSNYFSGTVWHRTIDNVMPAYPKGLLERVLNRETREHWQKTPVLKELGENYIRKVEVLGTRFFRVIRSSSRKEVSYASPCSDLSSNKSLNLTIGYIIIGDQC